MTAARSRLCIAGAVRPLSFSFFFLSFFLLRRVGTDSQVLLYFAGHVSYMELVYFNYDYNMKLCTLVTGAKFAMWLRVVYRSPCAFLMRFSHAPLTVCIPSSPQVAASASCPGGSALREFEPHGALGAV